MFTQKLTIALVSATLVTGALQTSAFASMGGGGDGGYSDAATIILNMPKKQNRSSASSTDRRTGETTTSRGASDGSRHITVTDREGRVIRTERVDAPKKADRKKNRKVAKKPGRSWASAYDPATGTRTTSIGLGNGTRAVITLGILGLAIGLSH